MIDWITIVSGFGRCGSSMSMQMLYKGGMPIDLKKAPWPFMEDERQTWTLSDYGWLKEYIGSGLKWLEPTQFVPPLDWPYRIIWLDRNIGQQAKSWIKYMKKQRKDVPVSRGTVREYKKEIRKRRRQAMDIWKRRGPILEMKYEEIKAEPLSAAIRMVEFCGHDLDAQAMARAVISSETKCQKGFLENKLIRAGSERL